MEGNGVGCGQWWPIVKSTKSLNHLNFMGCIMYAVLVLITKHTSHTRRTDTFAHIN